MLKSLVKEIKYLNGLIFYSLNLLPEKRLKNKFLNQILKIKNKFIKIEEIVIKNKMNYKKSKTFFL